MGVKPLSILIVDDDDVVREQVRRYLKNSKTLFTVEEAESQSAAKQRFKQGNIDCAILDFHMGDGDAFSLIEALRAEDSEFKIPLVLLTGVGNEQIAVQAIKLGIHDYINKDDLSAESLENGIRTAVAEQKLVQAETDHKIALEYLSMHDELTQLPNRRLVMERLEQRILISERNAETFSLLMIDLNLFKSINDTLGHHVGDEVLRIVAARLQRMARRSDTYARLGGDEFAVLLSSAGNIEGAITVANKISAAIKKPMTIGDQTLVTGASIGIATYPEHGRDAKILMAHADEAMYESKRGSYKFSVYNGSKKTPRQQHARVSADLEMLGDCTTFELFYQPKFELATGTLCAVEALARWSHPTMGVAPPAQFIPIVEENKFIEKFTDHVFAKAIRQIAEWRERGLHLPVSVNLSAVALTDTALPARLCALLDKHQVAPEDFTIEITESATLRDYDLSAKTLVSISKIGIGISIRDFGTGYTSIRYLKEFPVTELKIDRLFIKDVLNSDRDLSIVAGMIQLAKGVGARTVAEGIDDLATLEVLINLDCDCGQGLYLGHPSAAFNYTSDCRNEIFTFRGNPDGTVFPKFKRATVCCIRSGREEVG